MSEIDIPHEMRYTAWMSLNVSLTPHLEQFIHQSVTLGRYQTASEVIRTALRLLEEQEQARALRLDQLRREIEKGLSSGPAIPLDIEAFLKECRPEPSPRS